MFAFFEGAMPFKMFSRKHLPGMGNERSNNVSGMIFQMHSSSSDRYKQDWCEVLPPWLKIFEGLASIPMALAVGLLLFKSLQKLRAQSNPLKFQHVGNPRGYDGQHLLAAPLGMPQVEDSQGGPERPLAIGAGLSQLTIGPDDDVPATYASVPAQFRSFIHRLLPINRNGRKRQAGQDGIDPNQPSGSFPALDGARVPLTPLARLANRDGAG
jgi:hypothetical protein